MQIDAIEIAATPAASPIRYSICTLVTGRPEYAAMLSSFRSHGFAEPSCEFLFIDNSATNAATAFDGLNRMIDAARGRFVILCHHDVRLIADGRADLDRRLAMRISDPHGDNRRIGNLPERALSLDENFLVLKRAARIGLSHDLKGFHFYGADLCLSADVMGYTAYVIDFHLRHLSDGAISPSFFQARAEFRTKWSRALRSRWMQTTCGFMLLTGNRVGQGFGTLFQHYALRVARHLPFARGWPSVGSKS
jgi:hypothetical protein